VNKTDRPSLALTILTDLHFWVPAAVLAIGIGLLIFVAKV
jgi:hypothetical protein